LATVE